MYYSIGAAERIDRWSAQYQGTEGRTWHPYSPNLSSRGQGGKQQRQNSRSKTHSLGPKMEGSDPLEIIIHSIPLWVASNIPWLDRIRTESLKLQKPSVSRPMMAIGLLKTESTLNSSKNKCNNHAMRIHPKAELPSSNNILNPSINKTVVTRLLAHVQKPVNLIALCNSTFNHLNGSHNWESCGTPNKSWSPHVVPNS